jgi:hypothetical protein
MWFFEHLRDPRPVLREALRVLKPGGTITSIETDYATFKAFPANADWEFLERAQYEHFRRHGDAHAGRNLAPNFAAAGFGSVRHEIFTFHLTTSTTPDALRAHTDYIAGFLGPAVPGLAALGHDPERLRRGVEHLRHLWRDPGGSTTTLIYRVRAARPS